MGSTVLEPKMYILKPVNYNSSGDIDVAEVNEELTENQKGVKRLVLRAYQNPNYLGSPVFRRKTEEAIGIKVFVPTVKNWTVVQIIDVYEKAAFGVPVDLEKGLLISYFEYCRSDFNDSLVYDEENKTIASRVNNLISFEEWFKIGKPGYVSMVQRDNNKMKKIAVIEEEKNKLKEELNNLKTKTFLATDSIKQAIEELKTDLNKILDGKNDDQIETDIDKIMSFLR